MKHARYSRRNAFAPFAVAAAILCSVASLRATTRSVDTLNDDFSSGSLRTAVLNSSTGDIVVFAVSGTITLTLGELQVGHDLTINGPADGKITISGGNASRVFNIVGGNVAISNLTIANGLAAGAAGTDGSFGPQPSGTAGGPAEGGAILNRATLTLTNCTIRDSTAAGGAGGNGYYDALGHVAADGGAGGLGRGGALANSGTLTMSGCTISNTHAGGGTGGAKGSTVGNSGNGGAADGGAIYNAGNLLLVNCTASGNSSTSGGVNGSSVVGATPGPAAGGTIYNEGSATFVNATLAAGSASSPVSASKYGTAQGGILFQSSNSGSSASLINSIVALGAVDAGSGAPAANAVGPDMAGVVISQGHNLVGRSDGNSGWAGSDLLGGGTAGTAVNPQLAALADTGGLTLTRLLLAASPALDAADDSVLGSPFNLTSDQRGFARKVDTHVDIGAVERGPVQAGPTFTVTNLSEHDDGACTSDDCTLVEAVHAANASPDANTINFVSGLTGTIIVTETGGLGISNPLTINGPGARVLAIRGSNASGNAIRAFNITGTEEIVNISGLTITGFGSGGSGGAISNTATLNLTNCAVLNSSGGSGGGAANSGTLNVTNCTFAGNQSTGNGGALRNTGNMTVTNSTFYNNTSVNSGAIASFNGGAPTPAATLTVTNCTISGNHATDANGTGGGIFNGPNSTATVSNTIVANNVTPNGNDGPEVYGAFTSGGHNVIRVGVGSTGFTDGVNGDQVGGASVARDPNLDSLKNNGGPTDTMALLSGSLAINKGNDAKAPSTDQRGYFRNGTSDIGAFEANGAAPIPPTVSTGAATNVTTTTATLNATVNPNGLPTTVQFTTDFGNFGSQDIGSGTANVAVTQNVTGLTPGTQYHFNATASNPGGSASGTQQAFSTVAVPPPSPTPTPTPTATPATTPTPTPAGSPSPTPSPVGPVVLGNISTRVAVQQGDNVLIGGFIVTGTQPKKVLLRAIGPSTGIAGALTDPKLDLYSGPTLLESNDNWVDSPNKQAIIDTTIPPDSDFESAIVRTLPANNSGYTAVVSGVNDGTGVGLVEVYDLDTTVDSKLANISTRGLVQTQDNVMIGGFIVLNGNQKVIIRAIGPSLPVDGALQDPVLELHDNNGDVIETNDNWIDSPNKQEIIATTVPPTSDLESAIVSTLAPGNYTAVVRGVNDTTGVALVEVFALN